MWIDRYQERDRKLSLRLIDCCSVVHVFGSILVFISSLPESDHSKKHIFSLPSEMDIVLPLALVVRVLAIIKQMRMECVMSQEILSCHLECDILCHLI